MGYPEMGHFGVQSRVSRYLRTFIPGPEWFPSGFGVCELKGHIPGPGSNTRFGGVPDHVYTMNLGSKSTQNGVFRGSARTRHGRKEGQYP